MTLKSSQFKYERKKSVFILVFLILNGMGFFYFSKPHKIFKSQTSKSASHRDDETSTITLDKAKIIRVKLIKIL